MRVRNRQQQVDEERPWLLVQHPCRGDRRLSRALLMVGTKRLGTEPEGTLGVQVTGALSLEVQGPLP